MTQSVDPNQPTLIALEAARLLASAQGITSACIHQAGGKWAVLFSNRRGEAFLLKTARGDVRLCRTMEAAASAVKAAGLGHAIVKLDDWNPRQKEL